MAQAIAEASVARRGWDAVEIRSAGVSAGPGGPASEGAIGAAQSGGLDLAGHRSTPLDAELVDWANLVLTMGSHHADRAEELGGRGKVWMLTAFSDGGQDAHGPGVPDPFGGDAREYLRCLEALDTLVEAALGRIEAEYLGSAESVGSAEPTDFDREDAS
jgi:protein-tyrosine-phosphatase